MFLFCIQKCLSILCLSTHFDCRHVNHLQTTNIINYIMNYYDLYIAYICLYHNLDRRLLYPCGMPCFCSTSQARLQRFHVALLLGKRQVVTLGDFLPLGEVHSSTPWAPWLWSGRESVGQDQHVKDTACAFLAVCHQTPNSKITGFGPNSCFCRRVSSERTD